MVGEVGISVWTVAVDAVPRALWPQLVGLLGAEEWQRAEHFVFERDRRVYQAAHALKRLILSAHASTVVEPQTWTFEVGRHGKPRVAGGAGPRFNLSHCDGLATCAVSECTELGLDVENIDRPAPLEVLTTCFAASEVRWLRSLPEEAQQIAFVRLWTLKEAYIKAIGIGLAQPLDALAFDLDPLAVTFLDPALGNPTEWRFEQRKIGDRHILSLAWQQSMTAMPIRVAAVPLEALVDDWRYARSQIARRQPDVTIEPDCDII
jgi:4'-phosphopantetheinyl transferase